MTEPTIIPRQPPKRHVLRTARRLMLLAALAAAVAAASFVLVRKQPATSHAPATILKTAAVTSGNLTTTEKIDGSLVLSDTLNVLHRIEGQVSSAAPNASSTGAPSAAAGGSLGSSASGLVAAGIGATITDIADITDIAGAGGAGGVRGLGAGPAAVPPPGCPGGSSDQTTTTTAPPDTPPAGTSVPAATCPGTVDTTVASPTPSSTPDATSTTTGRDGADTTVPAGGLPPGSPGDTSTTTAGAGGAGGPAGGAGGGARSGAAGGGGTGGTSSGGGTGGSGATSSARITQTITSIIGVGATVGLGDVLYTVDSRPVVALSGALPAWRTLSTSSDDGPDVQQLESSLVSLGYDPTGTVTVDDNFDSHTKAMVERWQVGLGVDSTGTVDLGSVVFLPTTTTVSTAAAAVGDAVGDGDTIVTLTAATQQVVIDVPDGDEAFIVPGLEVQLGSAAATVALLRSIERNGAVVVQAVIVPAAPIDGVANGATVKVTITTDNVDGVMVVPANALLSHLDGTYAVQVQAADGTVSWHTVELLGVSGNQVGIRGDGIVAGTLVLVPV